jgi:hypothetical protein
MCESKFTLAIIKTSAQIPSAFGRNARFTKPKKSQGIS